MTLRGPPPRDEAQGRLDLRAHRARRELALRRHTPRISPSVTRPSSRGLGRAPADDGVGDVGGDDEHVGADGAGEQGGREVLVDDRLDAVHGAVGAADDGDAAAAGRDDDVAGVEQRAAAVCVSSTSSGSGEATTRRQPFSPRSSQRSPWSMSVWACSRGR